MSRARRPRSTSASSTRRSAGVLVKLWMFVMRLSCSGRAFHVAFATQAQEAFLEGHVLAFEYFGGGAGPDPLRQPEAGGDPGAARAGTGPSRSGSSRCAVHYGFDSFFCRPGMEGAHEKGGVEGEIGRFRRRHLVPVPDVASLAELNELIAAADVVDDARVITGRPVTVGAAFAAERPRWRRCRASRSTRPGCCTPGSIARARVCVRQYYYSVPARFAGRRLTVRLSATQRRGARRRRGSSPGTSGPPAVRRGPGPGPLPGGAARQTRRAARRDRAGPGQGMRARSPRPTSGTGTPPAASSATRPAPGR